MARDPVYIIDCRRTAIGSANKSLKNFEASQLAAFVIDSLLADSKISKENISEVIMGNAVSAGTGQNLARHAVSLSSLPIKTPAFVVNNVCGSGLQAIILGAQKIISKEAALVISGAAESATHNPLLFDKKDRQEKDSLLYDGLFCSLANKSMGKICDELAKNKSISRGKQDKYALESHKRACAARKNGNFKKEIIPVKLSGSEIFDSDERPRERTSLERLGNLPPAFCETGTVTAGNASAAADGACAFVLASQKMVKKEGLAPLAKILGYVSIATNPSHVFDEGTEAVIKCLEKCRLKIEGIDLFEITEAFAAQVVLTKEKLNIPKEKMNIFGGDVALGHPLGIAGARALVTLVHALRNKKKKKGLAYTPFGAGGAIALAVEVV